MSAPTRVPILELIDGNAALRRGLAGPRLAGVSQGGPERPRFDGPASGERRLDAVLRAIAHPDRSGALPPGFVPADVALRLRAGRAAR